jgi:hypothetical protein
MNKNRQMSSKSSNRKRRQREYVKLVVAPNSGESIRAILADGAVHSDTVLGLALARRELEMRLRRNGLPKRRAVELAAGLSLAEINAALQHADVKDQR